VGVVYGSDVTRAFETLMECAKENSHVVETPEQSLIVADEFAA